MARRTFPKDAGERVTLQTRTTTRTRDRLQEAANESGRSLSQEMEMRLEQSLTTEDAAEKTSKKVMELLFERDEFIHIMLGGAETFSLLQDIASLLGGVERDQDKKWFESPELRAQAYKSLDAALPALLKAPRTGDLPSAWLRAVDYARYLPERPKKPKADLPAGMRFMTDEELKQFFYTNDDNA